MAFLQPVMFWGALAIVIPIVIHFWYQKKGKTIAWAATQWLTDKTNLQHRGIRLDEIPLLLIRCLLIILLALLLAKPVADWLKGNEANAVTHVVETNSQVVGNYRFEIEEALRKGEKVYWISPGTEELKDVSIIPDYGAQVLNLQESVSQAAKNGARIHVYIRNKAGLARLPKIVIPTPFKIFSTIDSTKRATQPFINGTEGKVISADARTGLLTTDTDKNNLASEPVNKGDIKVLLDYKNANEMQTVQAALLALQDVYSIPFVIDKEKKAVSNYDWVFTDQQIVNPEPYIFYITSGKTTSGFLPENVIEVPDSMRLATSDLVKNGRLPEWLGNKLVDFYGLKKNENPLSQSQLNALFVQSDVTSGQKSDLLYQWLLLAFVLTLLLERWIAINKNVSRNYA
ncbi:BatA domain-containing protein [Dyadobacter sp. CY312]|uniref:BatA domain-containing protein n=1 Tax=Dyadobacter sp. CY312 TaxID=2907303 RepID=UPI001F1F1ED5|nr:BatA domain-containing protein [Dyadobacter sp. CY312]MCE7040111.1 BatA domain-containing protein [Dyadobacter sp. CY312]